MSWRLRAGLVLAAVGTFAVGWTPALRWTLQTGLTPWLSNTATLHGETTWSWRTHRLTLNDLRWTDGAGARWRAGRVVAKLDVEQFLRRNLVVDAAVVEGVEWHPQDLARDEPSHFPSAGRGLHASFDASAWMRSVRTELQNQLNATMGEHLRARRELLALADRIDRGMQKLAASNDFHAARLADRENADREVLVRDWLALRQAAAEERVGLRQSDRKLRDDWLAWAQDGAQRYAAAVAEFLPPPQHAALEIGTATVDRFLAEHADEMHWCRSTLVPQPPEARTDLGIDVPLTGLPARGPEVRLVAFSGHRHLAQGKVVPFEGSLRGWSAHLDREHSAQGTWIMASPAGDSDLRLDSTLSIAPTDHPNTATLKIEWKRLRQGSEVGAKESHPARTLQSIRLQPSELEAAAPMQVVIPWQWYGGDWFSEGAWRQAAEVDPTVLSCWQSALDQRPDLTLHAIVTPLPQANRAARASDVSWAPSTTELLTGLATEAMERYVVHCSREFAESQEPHLREDLDSSLARWQSFHQEHDRLLEGLQQRIASWRRDLDPASDAHSYRSAQVRPWQNGR